MTGGWFVEPVVWEALYNAVSKLSTDYTTHGLTGDKAIVYPVKVVYGTENHCHNVSGVNVLPIVTVTKFIANVTNFKHGILLNVNMRWSI